MSDKISIIIDARSKPTKKPWWQRLFSRRPHPPAHAAAKTRTTLNLTELAKAAGVMGGGSK
ncbi:hypothetical protein [Actinomyces minihominis]|uniref:hypothetical protein n=1 Tax=Actinomyces minihominis TaxID=2002838 RepID=UPI000C0871F4|nr:hypothetical protein [Actinomyces minihominis]